jgi:hypothetical protein
MISLICDACLARFQVTDDVAGTTIFCPKCGAKNGVPAREGPPTLTPPPSPTATSTVPSGDAPHRGATMGEELLLHVRPAMFRARPLTFSGLFLLAAAGIVGGIYLLWTSQTTWGIVALVASLLGVGPLAVWKVYTMGSSLEITNKRTVWYRGLLSKATNEVRHNDVKNFQVDQTFLNRILGIGTIGISSAGQDEIEIRVKDIPNPYRVRDLINQHRKL